MIGKFVGHKKIKNVKVSEEFLTPRGSTMVELEYEDGTREFLTSPMVEAVMTDEPLDPSALRDKRVIAVCKEILDVFGEYDPKLNEWDHIAQTIKMSIEGNFSRAEEVLWKTPEKRWLDVWRTLKDAGIEPIGGEE